MKIPCEYCGSMISDTDEKCPNCGATNAHLMRSADGVPKTIDELQAFCAARGLPLQKMRFFVGEDCREARAFGVYRDEDGDCIVYKNKSDGSRVVRYRGKDEAYAVNELYQKMKSEVSLRKRPASEKVVKKKRRGCGPTAWCVIAFFALLLLIAVLSPDTPKNGYYRYNDAYYYRQNSDWYRFDEAGAWLAASYVDETLTENAADFWQSGTFTEDYGVENFEDSGYYAETDESDWSSDDWDDDDWDVDTDSWDYGDTDWDSDW